MTVDWWRGVLCYKPTQKKGNRKETKINFRSVKSQWRTGNWLSSIEAASWQTVHRGQQGIMHPAESRRCSILRNLRFNRRHEDDVGGWTQEDKLTVIDMFFPQIYECLGVYLPDENKKSGFFKETKWTGKSWGSSMWAPAAHSRAPHTLALGLALDCPALGDSEQLPTASWINMSKPSGIMYQKDACNKRSRQTEKWSRKWR